MTLDEFLGELRKTPRLWELSRGGFIRFPHKSKCPLEVVAGCFSYRSAADQLGVNFHDGLKIAQAADNDTGHDPKLRARLLKACGPSE